ncbi:NAD(P)/FAD-dependent oxidoreductase [Odoribacter sp. OttesenSCG-928-L07]|nr:NAD(P)/FAD-dependent oxidoreductase [Odoribacter sp. OttesenSCG-928-L07]MDL2238902.1 NAD(P)/FAD-dependent oxidoreductase [Bacteroidales bacterium OttesenSCG-928-L14]MDL2240642.1 NAD(P)/FAD-dependent oxidoreductase [Bacteroidales bacterium OttesenSCG-928-K22]
MGNDKHDVIIVGSGLGGLVCGYILSKNGYKVLIVEKNSQKGGCLQTFKRDGVKFDTGMHYIGSMEEGQVLYRFFKYFNLLDDVPLSRLDKDGYDVISINGEKYKFASGFENFTDELAKKFPENINDIEEYVRRVKEIADASPLYKLQTINTHVFIEADYIKTGVNEFVESCTKNKRLQAVLAGNLPLYAGVKDKTPTYIHALINNFYIQSAYRIVGGSDSIVESLTKSIESFGGKVMNNAEVEEFVCDDKKVVAVLLKNGKRIEADYFISNVHPQVTLDKINSKLIRKVYRERIANLDNTISNFTVFIKFKKNATPYLNYNFYYYDNDDVWAFNDYDVEAWPQSYLYMHQSVEENAKFAESAQVIAYMKWDEIKQWENTTVGKRGKEYEAFKVEKTKKMLDKLEESFPGIKEKIESVYTSSPLTYRDYTATKHGSMYGIIRDKNFPTQTLISQRTKLPNLFMTGQNINSHGILGVTIGAMITCSEFLGINEIIKDIEKANS